MKRYIALIFVILACFPMFHYTVRADTANDLTRNIGTSCEKIDGNPSFLFDGDISTRVTLTGDSVISLKSDTPVKSLYLVWNEPPNVWDLALGDLAGTYGRYGFIHEYISFDEAGHDLTLTFHGSKNILCDLYAFSEGEAPDWAEQWLPPLGNADMLLLPAHAGDESSYLDEIIPRYIDTLDTKIQLSYITNQWLTNKPSQEIIIKTTHEIISALYAAGIRAYPVISDFPDTLASSSDDIAGIYDEDAFINFYVEQIRRFKPKVIIFPDFRDDGISNLCFESFLAAAKLSGDELEYRDSSLEYGAYDAPKIYLGDELIRTRVGLDTSAGDFFQNIAQNTGPDTAPKQDPAAEALSADVDATSAAPNLPSPAKNTLNGPDSLTVMGGISVLCIAAATLLRIKKEW